MGQRFLRVLLVATAFAVLHASFTKADDATHSPNDRLPKLEVAKEYKLPPSPTATGLAAPLVGDAPTAVAWSPDGKELAAFSSYGQNLTVWNVNGDVVRVLHPVINYLKNSLAFINDDELLTQSENTRVIPANARFAFDIWSISKGAVTKTIDGPEPAKDWGANTPEAYTLSHDGSMVVMLAQETGTPQLGPEHIFKENPIPVYSTKTWDILQHIPIVHPISAAFSPDNRQVAFGQAFWGKIFVYETTHWKPISTIAACEGSNNSIPTIAFSPDGQTIVAGLESHNKSCAVRLYRVSDGALIGSYPDSAAGDPWKVLWHPSGKFIVFAPHDKTLRLWSPLNPDDPGTTIKNVSAMCLAFSPDGKQLAACNSNTGAITVFNIVF